MYAGRPAEEPLRPRTPGTGSATVDRETKSLHRQPDPVAVRVPADPTGAADLTRAEMQGRRDAHAMFRAQKRSVPGFERA